MTETESNKGPKHHIVLGLIHEKRDEFDCPICSETTRKMMDEGGVHFLVEGKPVCDSCVSKHVTAPIYAAWALYSEWRGKIECRTNEIAEVIDFLPHRAKSALIDTISQRIREHGQIPF
jgi:hypothetical protein